MTTSSLARAWQGPALLSYGFRPFFLFGALHAALMVTLWVPWHLGVIQLPSAFAPVVWHAHELLFGYAPAIVAGFLLTAVPNWTGRLPVTGAPLAGLFALWLLGRLAVACSAQLVPPAVAALSLGFPAALALVIGREIAAGRNWRNLKVLAGVGLLAGAQALFHYEAASHGRPVLGDRLAVAAILILIMIVGGRVVPSFTGNWIRRANPGREPKPFGAFDKWAMGVGMAGVAAWASAPLLGGHQTVLAPLLLAAGAMQALRLARWAPDRTLSEPIVAVLHLGFAFVPLGFLLNALAAWRDDPAFATAGLHAWTVGAIGVMTLAMMSRASRGHTGHALAAPPSTVAVYLLIAGAAFARIAAALLPEHGAVLLPIAGAGWVAAFVLFAATYGPMLWTARRR